MALERKHYGALKTVITKHTYDPKFDAIAEEALEIIKDMVQQDDVEIAAALQKLTVREREREYINDDGEIFVWTDKGFVQTGHDFEHMKNSKYCTCPYPKDHELHNKCEKCNKELL